MSEIKAKLTQERFKDAPFFNPELSIIIAGLGGIGSNVSYILCRQGYETYVYDHDSISIVNIGSQMYSLKDIGKNKAEKAKELAAEYDNTKYTVLGKFEEHSPIDNIVFACFDNMAGRKLLFEKWYNDQLYKTPEYRKENPNEVNMFVDGRMLAENLQIFFVKNKIDAELYKTTLFEDSEIEEAPCSYKATCQTGTLIASLMSIGFLNHVANKKIGKNVRDIPFAIEYGNPLMDYRTYTLEEYANKYK